jgi:hypothetical protein
VFDYLVDFCFFIDIVLTFFTVTQEILSHQMETRIKVLALNYIKTNFFIDVVSTFPFQLIEEFATMSEEDGNAKLLRLSKINRLNRLVRLARLIKLLRITRMGSKKTSTEA